ncbi:MAG: ferritin family protein [Candidatus Aminicenantales bacterium]
MKKISNQVQDFIQEAIQLEIRGREFFTHAAELTHNQLGKKMFQRLADEEVRHLEVFSRLFSSVLQSEEWKKAVKEEELQGKSSVIEELVSRVKRAEDQSEIEALRIGMELELKAIDFFKGCVDKGSDPAAKEIFDKIADEERFHYDLLQAQYDSVTRSGFWLDSSEFQMDGKY